MDVPLPVLIGSPQTDLPPHTSLSWMYLPLFPHPRGDVAFPYCSVLPDIISPLLLLSHICWFPNPHWLHASPRALETVSDHIKYQIRFLRCEQ